MHDVARLRRLVFRAAAVLVVLATATGASFAQGFYYKEIRKDDRIYVFNVAANAERFEKSGEMGIGITRPGAGPNGETVVGDNERALQLFFFKYGIAEAVPEPAQPPAPAAWRISGYVFGDYYAFVQDHDSKFDDQRGFWIRRAYLTYDHNLSARFTTRLRLEANSNGKMAGGALTPYIKDAYLRWTYRGPHQVTVGMQPSLTFEALETLWGFRHVEKTPADLYRFDSSRDLGVTFSGPINAAATAKYAVQAGNDSGTGSETDNQAAFRFSARYDPNPGLFLEGYYGFSGRTNGTDRNTFSGVAGYQHRKGRVGFNYLWQGRQESDDGKTAEKNAGIVSGFGVYNIRPQKLVLFGRVDRALDTLPSGDIDYLPISTASEFTFTLVGIEYFVLPSVRFAPNVEWVRYDQPASGDRPDDDVVLRATFYWVW